jgi:hypothetical protein
VGGWAKMGEEDKEGKRTLKAVKSAGSFIGLADLGYNIVSRIEVEGIADLSSPFGGPEGLK